MDENGSCSPKREQRSRSRSPVDRDRRRESRQRTRTHTSERSRRGPSTRRVYVANIAFECKWTEIKDLFREKVGDVAYVEFFNDENGKFRGCGIVELKDAASAQKAIDVLHRYEYKGRNLVVKEDYDAERDKYGRHITRSSRSSFERDRGGSGDMGHGGMPFNTYGLSPQFLESLGISGPLTNKVFVANLDYKVTARKLQEIFQVAGRVQNAELKTDKDGNSKGHGTISFQHPVEAVQAISMLHGQKLYSRSLSVRMDKFNEEPDSMAAKLPNGLQSIGKGLGAGGQPIDISNLARFSNSGSGSGNSNSGGIGMSGSPNMGNMMGGMGGMNSLGANGNMGAGMGGNERNLNLLSAGLGAAAGLTSGLTSAALGMGGLGTAGAMGGLGGIGASLGGMGLGAGGMSSERNLLSAGLGNLGSSLGSSGVGLGISSVSGGNSTLGGGGGGGGYGDYDRGYDGRSGGDSYARASDTIIVRNFPASFSWQDLRDRFKEVGDVCYTEMKSRGSALVRFSTERDAQRAIDRMNGIRIDGRSLEVQFY